MPSVTGQETRPRAYQDRISRLDAGVGSLGQRSRDFLLWALVSFLVARHRGRLISGVAAGLTIALGTFLVYDLLILVRVNLLLGDPTGRADWQDMMARFQASGVDSLRLFVNVDYLTGAPLKLGVSCTIGAIMGVIGGSIGALAHRRTTAAA